MKKIFLPIVFAATLVACKNNDKLDKEVITTPITLNPSATSNADTAIVPPPAPAPQAATPAPQVTKVVYVTRTEKPTTKAPVRTQTPTAPPVVTPVPAPSTETAPVPTTDNGTVVSNGTGTETQAPAEVKKKEGMSNAAKGAIIGGVGGAAAGAVIGKNGKGAVIGGVVGAAGGYILGKKKDKKEAVNQ